MRVATGLERVVAAGGGALRGRRIGLIANPTAVDAELRHAIDLLHGLPGVELAALFGPEHGLRGDAQDMIGVDADRDARTGLPVWSLYGHDAASLSPPIAPAVLLTPPSTVRSLTPARSASVAGPETWSSRQYESGSA